MINDLFPRNVVVVLFYDKELNLLVENRRKNSKVGEEFGFFGGGVEQSETSEQALRRELEEELGYSPKELEYWGRYSFNINFPGSKYDGETRFGELFLSPITSELMKVKNDNKTLLPLDRVLENRNNEFGPIRFNDVAKIKHTLVDLTRT